MRLHRITLLLCITFVSPLTIGANSVPKLNVPPCPPESKRVFYPDAIKPKWTGCKDSKGLYQGLIIQLSNLTEVLRIASIKDSFRNGKEIRFGASGTLEERTYKEGHLNGHSYLFKSDAVLGRIMPKPMQPDEWKFFLENGTHPEKESSLLKAWLKQEPQSTLTYQNGRIERIQFEKKDYTFKILSDGRILSQNHPEMKGMYFIDPEPLWILNADDLKKALLPGFGSCKKYAGPIGRYGRYFDHLLYKREKKEKEHLSKLKEMRDRFIHFCVPEDIRQHLGTLECPPLLPSNQPNQFCELAISDQLHLPYLPKFFKNELTAEMVPEDFVASLMRAGLMKFASDYENKEVDYYLNPEVKVQVKKQSGGFIFKVIDKDAPPPKKQNQDSAGAGKDWAEWHLIPGF